MTGQRTPVSRRGNEQQAGRVPRDAGSWAPPIERLDVRVAPAGAINLNVSARREVGALQGFGRLWQKTYRVELTGIDVTPAQVMETWKAQFPAFQPPHNRFYPALAGVQPGEILLINATLRGMPIYTGVRVIYADDESFTVVTPQGHPESGWNTFSAWRDDAGTTVAQVQSLARANDPLYELGFRLDGSTEQERIWRHVLEALAAHFGVTAPVTTDKVCVDPRVQWSQASNIRYNAGARSVLYAVASSLRRLCLAVSRTARA